MASNGSIYHQQRLRPRFLLGPRWRQNLSTGPRKQYTSVAMSFSRGSCDVGCRSTGTSLMHRLRGSLKLVHGWEYGPRKTYEHD